MGTTASPARRRLLLAALAVASGARAGEEEAVEYQVKAAFVCKFGNYVEWPPQALGGPGEPFRIGVLGAEAVAEAFRHTARAASVAGRAVEVHRLAQAELPEGLHAVFVARSMAHQAASVLAAARGRPILTVTELEAGEATGMINFVVVDDKVRFDILLPAALQSRLKISVRLLGVARRVEGRS
jgi:hypothetical protein